MYLRFLSCCVGFALLPFVLHPSDSRGQGFGGMSRDPNEMFNRFSGGKDYIDLSIIPPEQRAQAEMGLRFMQITPVDGRITRQQFLEGAERMRAMISGMRGGMGGFPSMGGPPGPGGPSMMMGRGMGGPPSMGGNTDQMAEGFFRRSDRNQNGVIDPDEASDRLRPVRDKYDTNRDGLIDLEEYKVYIRDQFGGGSSSGSPSSDPNPPQPGQPGAWPGQQPPPTPDDDDDPPVVVFRSGKLPKDMPKWFESADTNKDGQVALYEWRAAGRNIEEFLRIDVNGDALITINEALKHHKSELAAVKDRKDDRSFVSSGVSLPAMGMSGPGMGTPGLGGGMIPTADSGAAPAAPPTVRSDKEERKEEKKEERRDFGGSRMRRSSYGSSSSGSNGPSSMLPRRPGD